MWLLYGNALDQPYPYNKNVNKNQFKVKHHSEMIQQMDESTLLTQSDNKNECFLSLENIRNNPNTYHICNLIFFPRSSTVLILKSMPIVEMNVDVNASSEKRKSIQVLPTPESPISNNLNNKS